MTNRMHWGMNPPGATRRPLAAWCGCVRATAGFAGVEADTQTRKFVIDFAGGQLSDMPSDAELEPIASAQNGEIVEAILSRVDGRDEWRLVAGTACRA
ncbi:glucan biosynthesis protein [Sulfitobacter sp. W074]|uniref:glucan biosynthesis protein n=1 Tax=Sulfitobacter sp. W074 TaxID=2867026 RepID=UPI0021A4AB99|nr:glucan biosynthesis protein [Sulfitobacter sp. W074]